jgi:hypothetical protein
MGLIISAFSLGQAALPRIWQAAFLESDSATTLAACRALATG